MSIYMGGYGIPIFTPNTRSLKMGVLSLFGHPTSLIAKSHPSSYVDLNLVCLVNSIDRTIGVTRTVRVASGQIARLWLIRFALFMISRFFLSNPRQY